MCATYTHKENEKEKIPDALGGYNRYSNFLFFLVGFCFVRIAYNHRLNSLRLGPHEFRIYAIVREKSVQCSIRTMNEGETFMSQRQPIFSTLYFWKITKKTKFDNLSRQVDPSINELKKILQKNQDKGSAPWTCKKGLQVRFKYYNEPFSCIDELIPIYI